MLSLITLFHRAPTAPINPNTLFNRVNECRLVSDCHNLDRFCVKITGKRKIAFLKIGQAVHCVEHFSSKILEFIWTLYFLQDLLQTKTMAKTMTKTTPEICDF